MQFPNRLQSVLLFDAPIDVLEGAVRDFARIEEMKSGATFGVPETRPGRLYRLQNSDEDLVLTFEYFDGPANPDAFRGALGSMITEMCTPDIRDRLAKTRSHLIIEIHHGAPGEFEGQEELNATRGGADLGGAGATAEQFHRRLAILTLASRIVTDHAEPLAVHWKQSGMLLDHEKFEALAAIEAPGPLHIQPYLFGPEASPGEPAQVGIRTIGAEHWLGREVVVEPNTLPWVANFEAILSFVRMATAPNGCVIPDGDTFGPEDGSISTRVTHRGSSAQKGGVSLEKDTLPFIELTPIKHAEFDFVHPDFPPDKELADARAFAKVSLAKEHNTKIDIANLWRESRRMANALGTPFEARATAQPDVEESEEPAPPSPPPENIGPRPSQPGLPSVSGSGLRAKVFGRKSA